MSVRVMAAAWATDIDASDKIVLLALADRADDDGHCWPGVASLAAKCGLSTRSVQRAIQALVGAGHLSRLEVSGKGCTYTVHPRQAGTPDKLAPVTNATRTPDRLSPNTSRNTNTPSDASHPSGGARDRDERSSKPSKPAALPSRRGQGKGGYHPLPLGWVPVRDLPDSLSAVKPAWPDGWYRNELDRFREWAVNAKDEKGKGLKKDWHSAFWKWLRGAWQEHEQRYGAGNGAGRSEQSGYRNPLARAAAEDNRLGDF